MTLLPIVSENSVSLNWHKIIEVGESLLLSPIIGFWLAFTIMTIAYKVLKKKDDFLDTPKKKEAPEVWLKSLLIWASCWVSFAHGSNDGQKWVWLATLILISLLPSYFAVNPKIDIVSLKPDIVYISEALHNNIEEIPNGEAKDKALKIQTHIDTLTAAINNSEIPRKDIRSAILMIQRDLKDISSNSDMIPQAQASSLNATIASSEFQTHTTHLYSAIDYAPWWIIAMISISIGLWTMFGRKRIVKTLGKKIGNHKMNYAESTSSALITALTITTASKLGLPVSTTHIFSSSIAWCMMTGKKPWLQEDTIKHILMAWVLTLPSTILISWTLFCIFWVIFLR
jgi:inorganic phosphate transporter, PiT family